MKKLCLIIVFVLPFVLSSCAGVNFSFLPGVINYDIYKLLRIENFYNDAVEGPANMQIDFTERLKDYFLTNTPLKLVTEDEADMVIEGGITSYTVAPAAPGGGEDQTAQLQRLTITVSVDFIDNVDDNNSFEGQRFSFFQDFDANQNLTDVETELVDAIFEQLVFDIFNKTAANW